MTTHDNADYVVCPRRGELFAPRITNPPDRWREDRSYRFCSYCGSLHPDEFMAAVENGAEVGPTDKAYKAYIDVPETEPGEPRVISATNDPELARGANTEWVKIGRRERKMMERDGWSDGGVRPYTHVQLVPREPLRNAKFYYLHLSDEQQLRFADLLESAKLTIGIPGYFYGGLLLPAAKKRQDERTRVDL